MEAQKHIHNLVCTHTVQSLTEIQCCWQDLRITCMSIDPKLGFISPDALPSTSSYLRRNIQR